MQYTTAIGGCQYTGPVDEQRQLNGFGEAYFNDGHAVVVDTNDKYGVIDTKGNITIPCKWRYIGFYEKGIYEVEDSHGNRLFIDNSGKVVK